MSFATACSTQPTGLSLQWSQLPPLPDSLGVAGAFAGVSDGALLVAGGANFPGKMPWAGGKKVWHDAVYALDEAREEWRLVGKLPHPLAYGISVTTKSGLVCIGGSDSARHYAEVFVLNLRGGALQVRTLPSLPVPLANGAGALVGSAIYVAGGSEAPGEQAAINQYFVLSLEDEAAGWKAVAPCPGKARILPVAAAFEHDFYLFGGAALEPANGRIARVYLRDAWRYNSKDGWQQLADLPKPCVAGPTPAPNVGDDLLLVGGDDGSRVDFQPVEKHPGFLKTILAYNVKTGHWRADGEVPAARATAPVVFWRNQFVIPSGEMRPGVRSPQVWMFKAGGNP